MLNINNHLRKWATLSSWGSTNCNWTSTPSLGHSLKSGGLAWRLSCSWGFRHQKWTLSSRTNTFCGAARRRVRYDENGNDDEENDNEEYGHNEEIVMLELYTQNARGEALLVKALLDAQEVEVLIFKGFSSCLSYRTSPDPSKSILPARAVIKSIDRIKGPFDPSNIEYLQKGLTWEEFKSSLLFSSKEL